MLKVGVDIGGTFTDITILDERTGQILSDKVLTTPKDPSLGVLDGLKQMATDLREVSFLVHGTTVAINALIENQGARTGLITTRGFEDVLEIGRGNRTVFFDIFYQRPAPLAPRRWRMGISERVNAQGEIVEPLNVAEATEAIDRLASQGVESVAVCFLNSFKNPAHERQVRDLVQSRYPKIDVSLSSDVLPEIREYERMSTTVTNGYLKPVIKAYIENLETSLRNMGSKGQLHVMQSNGGIMTAGMAKERPVQIIESGPVGGAVAAAYIVGASGRSTLQENVIAFDMGGTTSKSCVIHRGAIQTTTEYWPAGYMVKIPVVDIVEVGIGGGSIGWINPEGYLAVGPRSAGAEPGPVCYSLGGVEPTITDANVVLGRVSQLVGGRMQLDREAAERAIQDKLCKRLEMTTIQAALGILEIAVAKMSDTIRTVTVTRGIDPRDFTLCAFGGAGPMHAAYIARELGIPLVVIPPAPGTFSGLGFLCSDFRHDFVQTFLMDASRPDTARMREVYADLEAKGSGVLQKEGFAQGDIHLTRSLDMRYVGQAHEVNITLPGEPSDGALAGVVKEFHQRHDEHYGHSAPGESVEIVNLRVMAVGEVERPSIKYTPAGDVQAQTGKRQVYFQEAAGWLDCPLYQRAGLAPGFQVKGPAIIEEHTSTLVVPPEFQAEIDAFGNVVLRR
ncbi:MAG: hydantoinase/oxoprolinase family protein [Dehalococcoidia bacterium]|nr:hydantoinase/oxoprolinase family protein [Dehalococcoidia bacterium]